MKTHVNIFILGIIIVMNSLGTEAQENLQKIDTTEFRVEGVCNMCKTRIENAALIKGVKFTEWDKETKIITVIYRTDKVNKTDLEKAVAEAGHDTEDIKAKDNAYDKLPNCCAYRDGVQTH